MARKHREKKTWKRQCVCVYVGERERGRKKGEEDIWIVVNQHSCIQNDPTYNIYT